MRHVDSWPTLHDVKQDHHRLDEVDLTAISGSPARFVSNVSWDFRTPWNRPILHIAPGLLARVAALFRRFRLGPVAVVALLLDTILRGLRLWWASRSSRTVILLNLGDTSAFWFGAFRRLWPTAGKALASHVYLHPWPAWKRFLIRMSLRSTSVVAVWSDYQASNAENLLGTSGPVFLKVPYKANHSQQPREPDVPIGDYLFSGGNTERDYRTLFAAVEGLPLRVLVSCTNEAILRGLQVPTNAIVVAAKEPHFRRLMAGARMIVLCIKRGLLRGAGEATFLNAMWHGRPVIAADDGSASEYLEDGVTGFVVPAEDTTGLRQRILELWQDDELCERIGQSGRQLVEEEYTGNRWRERMMKLACIVLDQGELRSVSPSVSASQQRTDSPPLTAIPHG